MSIRCWKYNLQLRRFMLPRVCISAKKRIYCIMGICIIVLPLTLYEGLDEHMNRGACIRGDIKSGIKTAGK